jgi:hypothetical protein
MERRGWLVEPGVREGSTQGSGDQKRVLTRVPFEFYV